MPPEALVDKAVALLHDLKDWVGRPDVTLECKLSWLVGICARVADAHQRGVVHGGLDETRVQAARDGSVTVDLSPKESPLSGVSPEQLLGRPIDARSDVFAVAGIAYLILTGRQPFAAETLHAIIYRMVHEEPPDPRGLAPGLPEPLAAWLARGLAKAPADRFAHGGEMLEALRRAVFAGAASGAVAPSDQGGSSVEDAVPVERVDEAYAWLRARPCTCGARWQLKRQIKLNTPQLPPRYLVDLLEMRCPSGHERSYFFRVDTASDGYQQEMAETRRMLGLDD